MLSLYVKRIMKLTQLGSNIPDYNNGKPKYSHKGRFFYIVKPLSNYYLIVVLKKSGEIIFSTSNQSTIPTIENNIQSILTKLSIQRAMGHLEEAFGMLGVIMDSIKFKPNVLVYSTADLTCQKRMTQSLRKQLIVSILYYYGYRLSNIQSVQNSVKYILQNINK